MKVIVVGAGIIGLSVAEGLLRRGVEVELFERNPAPGNEASWAAAGILSPHGEKLDSGPLLELLRAGHRLIPDVVARLQEATGIDLLYRRSGELTLAFSQDDERELEREFDWQKENNFSVERVSASKIRSLEPSVDGKIRGALWDGETAQLDCRRFVEAYRRAVQLTGGILHASSPVRRFLLEGDRVVGVETQEGTSRADWVVNCAGSWAGFDQEIPLSVPSIPVKGQILQFRTEKPFFQRIVRSPRCYLVQRSPEELIAGTTVEYVGFDKRVTKEGRRWIEMGAREMASGCASMPIQSEWAGLRPGTPDHLPILGPTPFKGLVCATGHFRNGILLAPLTGQLIGDLITKGTCSMDLSAFGLWRFLAQAAKN